LRTESGEDPSTLRAALTENVLAGGIDHRLRFAQLTNQSLRCSPLVGLITDISGNDWRFSHASLECRPESCIGSRLGVKWHCLCIGILNQHVSFIAGARGAMHGHPEPPQHSTGVVADSALLATIFLMQA